MKTFGELSESSSLSPVTTYQVPVRFNPVMTAVVVKVEVVVTKISTFAEGFIDSLGMIYALHLSYPKRNSPTHSNSSRK